jgi:hypothetical protein
MESDWDLFFNCSGMFRLFYFCILGCIWFSSCEENIPVDPKIELLEVQRLSYQDIFVRARMVNAGDYEITGYGLNYSFSNYALYSNLQNFRLGEGIPDEEFSGVISMSSLRSADTSVFVRAWVENKLGKVYSDYYSLRINLVQVKSVYPSLASQGDTIVINGSGFNTNPDSNRVVFENIPAYILSASPDKLSVVVPENIKYDYSLHLEVSSGMDFFTYTGFNIKPRILSISPTSGTFGTKVTITLDNCPSDYFSCYMHFGDLTSYASTTGSNKLTATVPSKVSSASFPVRLSSQNYVTDPWYSFRMNEMEVYSLSPARGPVNTLFVIKGTNFHPDFSSNAVKVGGRYTFSTSGRSGSLVQYVPAELSPGVYDIEIYNSIDTLIIPNGFTVTKK